MADVARLAGVSTATVSYYLSGRSDLLKRVGAEARDRIHGAVAKLGYVQNSTARHLRRQRTERLCVLLPKLGIPFADKMAQDIDAVARGRGFSSIVVAAQDFDDWRRVLREVEAGLADGVVADADRFTAEELKALFEPFARLKPSVVLHPDAAPGSYSVVIQDRVAALMLALEHVRAKGHRHLAYIQNHSVRPHVRSAAVQAFAAAHAEAIASLVVIDGAESRETAAAAARRTLAMTPRPTAIILESDFSAVTVIEELQRAGVAVPHDIAVIGCGNAEEGYYCHPRLTTIGPQSMSLIAPTEHLIDIIENRGARKARTFQVPWMLHLRESG
jgi:LacI family repressor for deo operon, udp, cdd, tsx, nupC, and nupG